MPDVPTPAVNGQLGGSPAAHASMSISSFAPAASTKGLFASTASAGSFCLFCANGVIRLPMETRVSVAVAGIDAKSAGSKHASSALLTGARESSSGMIFLLDEAILIRLGASEHVSLQSRAMQDDGRNLFDRTRGRVDRRDALAAHQRLGLA